MKILDYARIRFESSQLFRRLRSSYPKLFDFILTLISLGGLPLAFGLVIAAVCWFAFFGVVEDYIAGDPLIQADLRVISFLQTLRDPAFNQVMLFLTYLGNWQVITAGSIAFALLLYVSRQWWWLGAFATSILGEQLLSQSTKFAFHRNRPNLDNALLPAAGNSFPSGHALVAFAFYGLIACYAVNQTKSWWAKALIIAGVIPVILGIGFSRIYLGVHWPSDVIASFALGPAWVATVLIVFSLAKNPTPPESIRPLSPWFAAVGAGVWLAAAITLFLTHPLIAHVAASPKIIALIGDDFDARLFDNLPRFTEDITGAPIEPINVIVVGSEADLNRAFKEATWAEATPLSIKSGLKLVLAELRNRADPDAPGLPAFLAGVPNDKTFERPTAQNSARERQHLHLWTTSLTDNGRPVWVGTAHRDTSGTLYRGVTYHMIAPDVDRERDALTSDLQRSSCLATQRLINVTQEMRGENILKNSFFTDGKAVQFVLYCR